MIPGKWFVIGTIWGGLCIFTITDLFGYCCDAPHPRCGTPIDDMCLLLVPWYDIATLLQANREPLHGYG